MLPTCFSWGLLPDYRMPRSPVLCLLLDIGYNAAKGSFTTFEAPGITAYPDALIKHLIDFTTDILGMKDLMGKEEIMHDLQIFRWENFCKWSTQYTLGLGRQIRAYRTNDGVHRM